MAYIEWSSNLETRIPVIDNQHRRIVDYINKLQGAIEAGTRDTVGEVLDELVDYTLTHFAFEEELMAMVEHPFSENHARIHRLFADRMDEYQRRYSAGEDVAAELNAILSSWLMNHIQHDDASYAPAVRDLVSRKEVTSPLKRMLGLR